MIFKTAITFILFSFIFILIEKCYFIEAKYIRAFVSHEQASPPHIKHYL